MSISNTGLIDYVADCDFCSETFDTGEEDFQDALSAMREEGWKIFRENGEWQHMCPSCCEPDFDDLDDET